MPGKSRSASSATTTRRPRSPARSCRPREFYDYEAKYLDGGSTPHIPAALDEPQAAEVRRLAVEAFRAVDGAGMARVDFLLSRETGPPLRQRGQHHSRLHHHQHVLEAVGGHRRRLPGPARSPDPARHRASRREAAAEDERAVTPARLRRLRPTPPCCWRRSACVSSGDPRVDGAGTSCDRAARADLRADPQHAVRSGRSGACRALCARAGGSLPGAAGQRRCGGASCTNPTTPPGRDVPHDGGRGHRGRRGLDRARAAARRRVVLPRRGVRRARLVPRAARRAAVGRARRQAHQGIARARARAGPADGRCAVRHRTLQGTTPTSRPRSPGSSAFSCCCPAAIGAGLEGHGDACTSAARCCAARPTTSSTGSTCGTRTSRSAPSSCSTALRHRYPANPHLAMRAGEIEDEYLHDAGASLGVVAGAGGGRRANRRSGALGSRRAGRARRCS